MPEKKRSHKNTKNCLHAHMKLSVKLVECNVEVFVVDAYKFGVSVFFSLQCRYQLYLPLSIGIGSYLLFTLSVEHYLIFRALVLTMAT